MTSVDNLRREQKHHSQGVTLSHQGQRYSRNSWTYEGNRTPAKSLKARAVVTEAFQNLSTPVQNAMRLQIDQDNKIVPPLPFMTARSLPTTSYVGARNMPTSHPKRGASFPISHTPTTLSNFSDDDKRGRFCIAKKIDTATKTDKEVAVPSRIGRQGTYTGRNAKPYSVTPRTFPKSVNDPSCSKDHAFSSAWSPEAFDLYFRNEKVARSSPIKNAAPISLHSQHHQNGQKESILSMTFNRQGSSANNGPNSTDGTGEPKVLRNGESTPGLPLKTNAYPYDPLLQVNAVFKEVKELEKQVYEFTGNSKMDKCYLVLDEMLTRCLIKLDKVNTGGRDDVMKARKESIKYIESCISKLEKKAPLC